MRAAVSAAARGVAGPGKGSEENSEARRRGEGRAVGRSRAPPSGRKGMCPAGLTARPSPREVRAPVARACAARRPRERALSAARALLVSTTHQLLRHQQQASPPPPPTFCRRRHNHLLLRCPLLSSPSVDHQVSAAALKSGLHLALCAILLSPLTPEMDLGRWASIRRNGGGLSAPSALGSWEGTRAKDARTRANACVCGCWGLHHPFHANGGGGRLCQQGGARMAVT